MSRVAEAAVSGLAGTLVEAHLQAEVTLARPQLVIRESPLVFVGHLWSQPGSRVLGVQLSLEYVILRSVFFFVATGE